MCDLERCSETCKVTGVIIKLGNHRCNIKGYLSHLCNMMSTLYLPFKALSACTHVRAWEIDMCVIVITLYQMPSVVHYKDCSLVTIPS